MSTFNRGEYGSVLRVNLGTDISTGTELTVILQRWRGDKDEYTSNVVVGTVNVVVDDQTFLANQYLEYTIQDGDLDKAGQWRAKGKANVSGVVTLSDYVKFTVLQ